VKICLLVIFIVTGLSTAWAQIEAIPVLTEAAARQSRIYNTAALNVVLLLKNDLEENKVTWRLCLGNHFDAPVAAADLVAAFKKDPIIPASEKRLITRNREIYCLENPSGGLSALLDQTCKDILATAPSYTVTTEQLSKLNTEVKRTLDCMSLE